MNSVFFGVLVLFETYLGHDTVVIGFSVRCIGERLQETPADGFGPPRAWTLSTKLSAERPPRVIGAGGTARTSPVTSRAHRPT